MPELAFRNDEKELVHQIHKLWDDAEQFSKDAQAKYKAKRIRIGQALLEAKRRCEAGDFGAIAWWDWYKRNFARSRQDAHAVMVIAASDDPVGAHEAEKTKGREKAQAFRDRKKESVRYVPDRNNPTESKKPDLKVVESATPPAPVIDYTIVEDTLRNVKRMNIPTLNYFVSQLRKAYRESWQ